MYIRFNNDYKQSCFTVKWLFTLVIKYDYSIVKQYAWVLNTRMRDLPLKILDFCTLRKGVFYAVLGLPFILTRVNSPPCVNNHSTV